jgi:PAS domain S-box-containing protein
MRSPDHALQGVPSLRGVSPSRVAAAGIACAAVALAAAMLIRFRNQPSLILLGSAVIVLCIMALLHARFLQLAQTRFLLTRESLDHRNHEFHSVFDRALDAILILDDQLICQEANPAASRLLGVDHHRLVGRSMGQFSADSAEPSLLWRRLLGEGPFRGRMELLRADGARILTEFTSSANMLPSRHLLMLRDSTAQVRAEEARSRSLAVAKSNFLEAQVLRNATLALTHSAPMNAVLDNLLENVHPFIPYETAQVLLLEAPGRLFLAREVCSEIGMRHKSEFAETVNSGAFPVLMRALEQRGGLLVSDTRLESDWRNLPREPTAGSWLGVRLYTGEEAIGILSFVHTSPNRFTSEHLRLAASLAIPASLAVQNARLHERAEIFRAELERHLSNPQRTEN